MSRKAGFADAAEKVLKAEGKPLHSDEITEKALALGLLVTDGKTPAATMNAILAVAIKKRGDDSRFVRAAPATFGLRSWVDDGKLDAYTSNANGVKVRIPHFPEYDSLRATIRAWEGEQRSAVTGLRASIVKLRGTPQNPVDWTHPEVWIEERLSGDAKRLANKVWGNGINPRYTFGHWLSATNYGLVEDGADGLSITARGHDFLDNQLGEAVRDVDEAEGVLKLLALVAESGPATRKDLLGPWSDYLDKVSNFRSDSTARSALSQRRRNLLARGLINQEGHSLSVTEDGLAYLKSAGIQADTTSSSEGVELWSLIARQAQQVKDQLREVLHDMDPYAFEHLIKHLLDEMGYDDVEVTKASNDKGVDVVGSIEVGITSVQEVIQAKRTRGNVQRPVLDALRGSLHRWKAQRGTIITTAGFSKGTRDAAFEAGAAPITLIDGEKLVELLIENGIGVTKKPVMVLELDLSAFDVEDETSEA